MLYIISPYFKTGYLYLPLPVSPLTHFLSLQQPICSLYRWIWCFVLDSLYYLPFSAWLISFSILPSRTFCIAANGKIFIPFDWIIAHYMYNIISYIQYVIYMEVHRYTGFLGGSEGKKYLPTVWERLRFHPWGGKIPWRREWQNTP